MSSNSYSPLQPTPEAWHRWRNLPESQIFLHALETRRQELLDGASNLAANSTDDIEAIKSRLIRAHLIREIIETTKQNAKI